MNNSSKHISILSIGSALYCSLLAWFFNPYQFIGASDNGLLSFLTGLIIAGLMFTILVSTLNTNERFKNLATIVSLTTTPLIASLILFFIFGTQNPSSVAIYFGTFLILPILPVAVYLIMNTFRRLESKTEDGSDSKTEENNIQLFELFNNKGKRLVAFPPSTILCFEANDNYVIIYTINANNEVEKSMQRLSLKKVETKLEELQINFYRVHKSYLINPDKIEEVLGKSQAYRLKLTALNKEIPVSRNFDVSTITE